MSQPNRPARKRPPAQPSEYEFWFVDHVRRERQLARLNRRQQKMLARVRSWEKYYGPLQQKTWNF